MQSIVIPPPSIDSEETEVRDRVELCHMLKGKVISDYMISFAASYGIKVNREERSIELINPTEKEAYAVAKGYRTAYSNRVR